MLNQSTFTRRNFLAGAGTVAAAVAAGLAWQPESAEAAGSGALGVYAGEYDQSERNQEDASGEQPTGADLLAEVEAATGSYTPGTYTASTRGNGGPVTVAVEVDDHAILSVAVEGEGETAGIGTLALEALPDAIVAANGIEVEGVSGATVTSDAVKRAVADALRQARGEGPQSAAVADGRYVTRALGMLSYRGQGPEQRRDAPALRRR